VVWQSSPTPGTYYVRANLFDACGEGSVRFVVSLLLPEDRPDGAGRHLVEKLRIPGQLVALDANGGAGPGLFVTQFDFRLPEEVVPVIVEKLLKVALLGSSWVMYLLIGLSILSLSLMIERCLFFWRHRDDLDALEQRLHGSLHEEDFDQADRILAESRSLEARVLRRALRWAHGGADAFQEVVASELGKLRRELERGMTTLGTLGNNAPFIGLLGTVIGVIEAFHQLGDAGQNKGAMGNVMAGIAEALVATGIGLFVALPAVVAFNAFQKKIGDVEGTTEALAHLISAAIKTREAGVGRVVELTVDEEPEVVAPRVAQVEG
jgi:biopolymer transport protein ExbB/biopolymer transport protein TolQ